jgi:hypothetical protein
VQGIAGLMPEYRTSEVCLRQFVGVSAKTTLNYTDLRHHLARLVTTWQCSITHPNASQRIETPPV